MTQTSDTRLDPREGGLRRAKAAGDVAAMDAAPNRRPHFTEGFRAVLMQRYERRWAQVRETSQAQLEASRVGDWETVFRMGRRYSVVRMRADALFYAANPALAQAMERGAA